MSPTPSSVALACLVVGFASPAHAARVPILDGVCDLSTLGVSLVGGLTINGAGDIVVLDDGSDEVYFLDRACGIAQPSFDISVIGSSYATGIAWDPLNGLYAIADYLDDELYFVDAAGLLVGSCDLAGVGSTSPMGVAYDALGVRYAVVDDAADTVFFLDDSEIGGGRCGLISQVPTTGFGSTRPSDITYMAASNQFAVTDLGTDEVYYLSSALVLVDQFDTAALAAANATALGGVYDPTADRFLVAEQVTPPRLLTFDVRGTSSQHCLTSAFASTYVTGLGQNSVTGDLLVTDSFNDQIYVIDAGNCAVLRQYGLAAHGATYAVDVAYLPLTSELVVVDTAADTLFFFDEVSGALMSSCSLGYIGDPTGVEYLPELDLLAITDEGSWMLVDTSCNLLHARPVSALDASESLIAPDDVTYHPGTGRMLVVAGSPATEAYVSNFEGNPILHWDLSALGLIGPSGVSIDRNDPTSTYVLSDQLDAIYRITVPALIERNTLSGRFTSAAGTTLYLWERGEGRVTGTLLKGGNLMPLSGQFDELTDTLYFGIQNGNKFNSGTMTVSPDRAQIVGPAALGTLIREY